MTSFGNKYRKIIFFNRKIHKLKRFDTTTSVKYTIYKSTKLNSKPSKHIFIFTIKLLDVFLD